MNIYADMEIFALEDDLSSEIRLMETDNITVTDWLLRRLRTWAQYTNKFNFTKDYERSIPLHNSVNINKYLICVHDHFWKIVMTDVAHSVIFRSKVMVAKNRLQCFEQAGCWRHSLDLSVALQKQCWFLPPKMRLTFYKEICATFQYCGNKRRSS